MTSDRGDQPEKPSIEPTGAHQTPRLPGQKPGNVRVRVDRPKSEYFRYTPSGALEARPKAHEEREPRGRVIAGARHLLFGRALASAEEIGERLSKKKALAIFSSDAISSSDNACRRASPRTMRAMSGSTCASCRPDPAPCGCVSWVVRCGSNRRRR